VAALEAGSQRNSPMEESGFELFGSAQDNSGVSLRAVGADRLSTWGIAHFTDIGGMPAGSRSPECEEIFQERIIIPPLLIGPPEHLINAGAEQLFDKVHLRYWWFESTPLQRGVLCEPDSSRDRSDQDGWPGGRLHSGIGGRPLSPRDKKAAPSAMPDAEVCGPSQGDKNAKPVSL
jgi:hypothetical protein